MNVRVIIERRAGGTAANSVLPLNIFLAQGVTPTASTATNDANLQSVITTVNNILGAQGISIGDIDYYDIADAAFDQISQGEEDQLFKLSSAATKVRLNLFLVNQVWGGQLLGLSAAIDGAKKNGCSESGVVSFYFDSQPAAIGTIIAHEICHYLGLWHVVEATGAQDPINDTNCPTTTSCQTLLMYWQGNGGTALTNGQGRVLRGHPCCHPPGGGQNAKPTPTAPVELDEASRRFLESLPHGWCGTAHGR